MMMQVAPKLGFREKPRFFFQFQKLTIEEFPDDLVHLNQPKLIQDILYNSQILINHFQTLYTAPFI